MKNNNVLEDLLDEMDDIRKSFKTQQADIDFIKKKLTESTSDPSSKETKIPSDDKIKSFLREALVSSLNHIKQQNNMMKQTSLSDADYKKLAETAANIYCKEFTKVRELMQQDEETEDKKIQEEYRKKREAQGFETVEQVAKWAPEYPYPIQRLMRYLGVSLFNTEEDSEKMKLCVKSLGDIMVAASHCQKPPTLIDWLKYRWSLIRDHANRKRKTTFFCLYTLGVLTIFFLASYQNKVMELDRTNHVFYKTIINDNKDLEKWHELDSIIHKDVIFYKRIF